MSYEDLMEEYIATGKLYQEALVKEFASIKNILEATAPESIYAAAEEGVALDKTVAFPNGKVLTIAFAFQAE